jgi:hypothetical protein
MSKKPGAANLLLFGKADTSDKFDSDATSVILAGDAAEGMRLDIDNCIFAESPSTRLSVGESLRAGVLNAGRSQRTATTARSIVQIRPAYDPPCFRIVLGTSAKITKFNAAEHPELTK